MPPGGWVRPTAGTVTSGFGSRWGAIHEGVDIAGPRGTPVYAAAAGTVGVQAPMQLYVGVALPSSEG